MTKDADIDLIVVTYNHVNEIESFLRSFDDHRSANIAENLLVVDVAPRDEPTRLRVGSLVENVGGAVVHIDTNIFYGEACNIGMVLTHNPAALLLNDDVMLTPNTVEKCLDKLMSDSTYGSLGPMQVDLAGRITAGGVVGPATAPKQRGWRSTPSKGYQACIEDSLFVIGSAVFTKRHAWNEMRDCELYKEAVPSPRGAMLPTRLYYEDTWYGYHLRSHGWKNVYYGEAKLIHKWHRSISDEGSTKWSKLRMGESLEVFRNACKIHGIECE